MPLPSRRAKIVATIGPASSDLKTIEDLIQAGVNVFRFNFSHGSHEDHKKRFELVQQASLNTGKTVAVLQDLQGPKLRVGKFKGGSIELTQGEEVVLYLETDRQKTASSSIHGTLKAIPYNYEKLSTEINVGHRILLDDGNLELVVTKLDKNQIFAQVVFGGTLKDHKGMNFPDTRISIEAFTEKDKADLLFGLRLGFDYVALSFVRSAHDVRTIQRFMHAHKKNIPVVAKIEKAEAISNLVDILEVTNAVMVARGDLAVEIGTAKVPTLQKQIIKQCKLKGIPVITATQMLESMIGSPRPTRAEASDVANAVLDGTDALMLSAESASGKFPILAVSTMHNIILETEYRNQNILLGPQSWLSEGAVNQRSSDALEHAASQIAGWMDARAIACVTHTGRSARSISKYRPKVPIFAITDSEITQRRLSLVWGVQALLIDRRDDLENLMANVERLMVEHGAAQVGDQFILTAGWPPLKHGTTNLIEVITVRTQAQKEAVQDPQKPKQKSDENIQGYRTREGQFILDRNLCIQCLGCVEVCPNDIYGVSGRNVYIKESNCKTCTFDDACMEICPTGAIEIIKLP